jgi:hypothetical protein
MDPLRPGSLVDPTSVARLPWRLARYAVENACTHSLTAGDRLANAHVRLAWEINAATEMEMRCCSFDPTEAEPRLCINVRNHEAGLRKTRAGTPGVFSAFQVDGGVRRLRYGQHEGPRVPPRHPSPRPTDYRELPAFGWVTRWSQERITVHSPPTRWDSFATLRLSRRGGGGCR